MISVWLQYHITFLVFNNLTSAGFCAHHSVISQPHKLTVDPDYKCDNLINVTLQMCITMVTQKNVPRIMSRRRVFKYQLITELKGQISLIEHVIWYLGIKLKSLHRGVWQNSPSKVNCYRHQTAGAAGRLTFTVQLATLRH